MFKSILRLFTIAGFGLHLSLATAQVAFPAKPMRIVVPFPPGGVNNLIARMLGEQWYLKYAQPVVIDNKPGGNGTIGSLFVARSAPDGYTVLFHGPTITVEQNLHSNSGFDVRRDLAPIGPTMMGNFGLHVSSTLPVNSVPEFLAYARQNPGKLNFGSAGIGSYTQLMSESFFAAAGIRLTHIPYQGAGPQMVALMSGQIDVSLGDVAQTRPQVQAGKIKLLALLSAQRSALSPGVPTIAEVGGPAFSAPFTNGLFAPVGTPPEIIAKLNSMIQEVMERPDIRARLAELGYAPRTSSTEEYKRTIDAEVDRMAQLVTSLKLKVD